MDLSDLTSGAAGAVLQQAGDAIIVIDAHGVVRGWNGKCEEWFGWSAAEAVGQDVSFMIPERLRPLHDSAFAAAMARGALASDGRARRTKSLTKTGEKLYIEMSFAMLLDDDGTPVGSIAVARPAPSRHED